MARHVDVGINLVGPTLNDIDMERARGLARGRARRRGVVAARASVSNGSSVGPTTVNLDGYLLAAVFLVGHEGAAQGHGLAVVTELLSA